MQSQNTYIKMLHRLARVTGRMTLLTEYSARGSLKAKIIMDNDQVSHLLLSSYFHNVESVTANADNIDHPPPVEVDHFSPEQIDHSSPEQTDRLRRSKLTTLLHAQF